MTLGERQDLSNETCEDSRLTEALQLLAREPISVLSLDIFDTLVWRVVPDPVDAFVLLGRRLQDAGHLGTNLHPELFARLRHRAESKARALVAPTTPTGEVSLEAIHEQIPSHLVNGLANQRLCQIETELEREICFPDLEVLRLAQLAQHTGARIALVSDTYYSERQLRRVLDQESFNGLEVSAIFSSSERKANKGSGLYGLMLDHLGVEPSEVLHIGDHEEADVAIPAKDGIHVVHFPKYPARLRPVLEHEGVLRREGGYRPRAPIDPVQGDGGLTALRSKAAYSSERNRLGKGVRPYWEFGASVMGPVFTGFAEWVHHRARQEEVTTVYCIMREGEFISRLVNGAAGYLGSPVRAVPLWLSRQLCARASIFEANERELSGFINRRRAPTLRHFCDGLGIGLAQLPELFNDGDGRLDDVNLWQRTVAAITTKPEVQAAIVLRSAELRERLVEHIVKTIGKETERVVLADLGWGATIQAHLDTALAGAGVKVDTLGLYLVTQHVAVDRMLEGVETDGYLASGGIPDEAVRWIIRSPEILEQICMTDVGTLVDFTKDGEPVCGPVVEPPVQMLQRVAVQAGALGFQRQWGRYSQAVPNGSRSLLGGARPLLLNTVTRFLVSPLADEAKMFASWSHEENYGSQDAETIVSEDLASLLKYMTPSELLMLPMDKLYWPFGLASLYNPPLAQAASAVVDGLVSPEAFTSTQEGHLVISADSLGLLSRLPARLSGRLVRPASVLLSTLSGVQGSKVVPVHPTGGGLCFARAVIEGQSVRGVHVQFPGGPGVVRLDRMSLNVSLRGRPDPVRVHIEWPGQFRQVIYAQCRPLANNLFFGPRRAPQVIYRCPREWGADVHKMEIELAFAWLPAAAAEHGDPDRWLPLRDMSRQLGRRVIRQLQSVGRVAE